MYNAQTTAGLIKAMAKSKDISVGKMLSDCALNKNALSSMQSRGSWLQANNLAKIADYLDCSVDYLLGRTNNPNNTTNIIKIAGRDGTFQERQLTDNQLAAIKAIIDQMPDASDDL